MPFVDLAPRSQTRGRPQVSADQVIAWADNPSSILALNRGTRRWQCPHTPGVVAYRDRGRSRLQVLGPIAADIEARLVVQRAFLAQARAQRRLSVAIQLQAHDVPIFEELGYRVTQVGSSWALPTDRYTLAGKPFVSVRNKISRARRAGLRVEHTTYGQVTRTTRDQLSAIDRAWLGGKGPHAKPLRFLVGEHAGPGEAARRLCLALDSAGDPVGYLSLSRVDGGRPGWLHDLSRRDLAAPPGTMELLVHESIQQAIADGAPWWHFGFTPFSELRAQWQPPSSSPLAAALVAWIAEHGDRVYPASTQVAYKRKWGGVEPTPEYIAFFGDPRPRAVWDLARAANVL